MKNEWRRICIFFKEGKNHRKEIFEIIGAMNRFFMRFTVDGRVDEMNLAVIVELSPSFLFLIKSEL